MAPSASAAAATKNRSINPHLPPPSPPWLHFSPASPPASSSSLLSFFRSRAPPRGAGLRCSCVLPGLRAHTALPISDNRERQAAIGFTPPGGESGLVLFPRLAVPTLTHGTLGRPKVKDCGDRRVQEGGPKGWTERGSGTSGRKGETERERPREKGAGGRDEANRLPSPPPGRTTPGPFAATRPPPRLRHIHSLLVPSRTPLQ